MRLLRVLGRWPWLLVFAVGLGVVLRAFHFGRDPSMWGDEAALVINVLGKSYRELLGPLFFSEAAPPLFLWVEKGIAGILGDGTYALRLVPFVVSVALVVLTGVWHGRWLGSMGAGASVLLLATSDRLLWHASEAKPYALDAFFALLLPGVECSLRGVSLQRRFLFWTVLSPIVIWLIYPGAFLVGGILAALLWSVAHASKRSERGLYVGLVAVVGLAFLALALGPARAQRCGPMESCWTGYFPDYENPLSIPGWLLSASVGVFDYSFRPFGGVLLLPAVVGAWSLWRRGMGRLVVMTGVPIGLAVVAALIEKYPFGGARVMVFAAPALALYVGAFVAWGMSALVQLDGKTLWGGRALAPVGLVLVAAALLASTSVSFWRVGDPWMRADAAGAMALVKKERRAGEIVLGNYWEHEYYARVMGMDFRYLKPGEVPAEERIWLVASDPVPGAREALTGMIDPHLYESAERHEFERTLVVLFKRRQLARPLTGPSAR